MAAMGGPLNKQIVVDCWQCPLLPPFKRERVLKINKIITRNQRNEMPLYAAYQNKYYSTKIKSNGEIIIRITKKPCELHRLFAVHNLGPRE